VFLIGSLARDAVRATSDLDLLVVGDWTKPFPERLHELYAWLEPRVGIDLLAHTPEE
jgi:predicted nucleotidyltransferase